LNDFIDDIWPTSARQCDVTAGAIIVDILLGPGVTMSIGLGTRTPQRLLKRYVPWMWRGFREADQRRGADFGAEHVPGSPEPG
jgi:hypothetical protein